MLTIDYSEMRDDLIEKDGKLWYIISYTVTLDDLNNIKEDQLSIEEFFEPYKIIMHQKNSNIYRWVVDNELAGRQIIGGLTSDGKYILSQYCLVDSVHKSPQTKPDNTSDNNK